jgi:hypothetical protein
MGVPAFPLVFQIVIGQCKAIVKRSVLEVRIFSPTMWDEGAAGGWWTGFFNGLMRKGICGRMIHETWCTMTSMIQFTVDITDGDNASIQLQGF